MSNPMPPTGSPGPDEPTAYLPPVAVSPPTVAGPVPPGQGSGGGMQHKALLITAAVVGGVVLCAIGAVGSVAATAALVNSPGHGHRMHQGGPGRHGMNGPGNGGPGRSSRGGMGLDGNGAIPGGLPAIEHGDVVITGPAGTPMTVRITHGQVTTVSASSITVKAADGYVGTYAVSATTTVRRNGSSSAIGAVRVGDTATVAGQLTGTTATALRINDADAATAAAQQQRRQQRQQREGGQPDAPDDPTAP